MRFDMRYDMRHVMIYVVGHGLIDVTERLCPTLAIL